MSTALAMRALSRTSYRRRLKVRRILPVLRRLTETKVLLFRPVASQEAQWLVKILNAEAKGRADPGSFVFHNQGVSPNFLAIYRRSR